MATKYLDYAGLQTVWSKVKEKDASVLSSAKSYADGLIATEVANRNTAVTNLQTSITNGTITAAKATSATNSTNATNDSDGNKISTTYLKASTRGATNGVASLGSDGKIPASQLPSYVDDVIEGYYKNGKFYKESGATTEITGETGKIYVDLNTNVTYRYTGNTSAPYCEISASLAIGETSSTAYSGASGKQNRTDINTLLGYFSNGVANKAKVITDGTTSYDTAAITTINTNVNTIKNNYVKQITSNDSVCSGILTSPSSIKLGVYDAGNTNNDSEVQSQVYLSNEDAMFTGYTNTYIGYKSNNGKAATWTDNTFIWADFKIEINQGDYAKITLEDDQITLDCNNGLNINVANPNDLEINGYSVVTLMYNAVAANVSSITSAELTALLV